MIPGPLVAVILFAVRAYSAATDLNKVEQDPEVLILPTLTKIKEGFTIDAKNPPYQDTEWSWEATCIEHFGQCTQAAFFHRNFLSEGTPNVTYTRFVETAQLNSVNGQSKLSMKTSTSVLDSTTEGWTIGAKLSLSGGSDKVTGGAEVSATYSSTTTKSKTFVKEFLHEAPCDPGYTCSIETWTFHIEVDGLCNPHGMINCRDLGTWDQCADQAGRCAQFSNFYDWNCVNVPKAACKVKTPVLDESEKPVSQVVLVAERDNATTKRSESEPNMPKMMYKIIG